eukprot:TRINITY_DN1044_c0_g1_i4.p1 TRINITY_DN1044_c0_g1~~TRINITY_DN1044_c0_g1_i4.p1  ORF type:complete len:1029 (+),score=255.57 TRINITY_DN1044_c0_g1_i4:133-3219(+)
MCIRDRRGGAVHQRDLPEEDQDMNLLLTNLEQVFQVGGIEGRGVLSSNEFVRACQAGGFFRIFANGDMKKSTEGMLELFQKIDVNNDGGMDWREVVHFLLNCNSAQVLAKEWDHSQEYVPRSLPALRYSRKNSAAQIQKMILIPKERLLVSSSADGSYKTWNSHTYALRQTVRISHSALNDINCSEHLDLLISASINGKIYFSRCDALNTSPVHHESIEHVPLCVTSWTDTLSARPVAHVAVGDDKGQVTVLVYPDTSVMSNRKSYRYSVHSGWITRLEFIAGLQCLVTASSDSTIVLYDTEHRRPLKSYLAHNQAVNGFAYSNAHRTMYSVGAEREVYVWDPYGCNTLCTMKGHTAHVMNVMCRQEYNQVVTQSVDHVIKIWDSQLYSAIQTIDCKQLDSLGNYSLSFVTAFPSAPFLIACTHCPMAWPMKKLGSEGQKITSHEKPIAGVVYIRAWAQVASVGVDGVVNLWNILTGGIALKFDIQVSVYTAIKSVALDGSERRLITGHKNANVCMWNTANGECLLEINCGQCPIEQMVYMQRHTDEAGGIWVGGRSIFIHGVRDVVPAPLHMQATQKSKFHKVQITAMTMLNEDFFATGCAGGLINVWSAQCNIAHACRLPDGVASRPAQASILDVLNRKSAARLRGPDDHTFRLGDNSIRPNSSEEDPARVECILSLVNCGFVFAASYADGMIRFWEFREGKLMGSQDAGYENDTAAFLITNRSQSTVFSSNEDGLIKAWKLDKVSLAVNQVTSPLELCFSFRTHMLISMTYLDGVDLLLTAGLDLTLCIWTPDGLKVGVLGQAEPYDLGNPATFMEQKAHLPTKPVDEHKEAREQEEAARLAREENRRAQEKEQIMNAVREQLEKLDANRDGVVQVAEFLKAGGSREEFELYDANADGVLDESELAHQQRLQRKATNANVQQTLEDAGEIEPGEKKLVPALKLVKPVGMRQRADSAKIHHDLNAIFRAQTTRTDRSMKEIQQQRYTGNFCAVHELRPVKHRSSRVRWARDSTVQPSRRPDNTEVL